MVEINDIDINNFDMNRIGALLIILEKLVELDKIKKYIESKNNFNEFSKYIKSYEFCICFCLDQLIEILRNNQKFLDFKEDLLFNRAYDSRFPRSKFPTNTEMCIFANNIFGLVDLIFKKKTYKKLRRAVPKVDKYILTPFKEIFYNNFEPTDQYKDLDIDDIISRLAKSYFHNVFHDVSKIRHAYGDIVNKGREFRALLNDNYFEELKKKKKSSFKKINSAEELLELFNDANINRAGNMQETLGDQLFFEGYKLIIDYLWNELFKNPFSKYEFLSKIILSKDWKEFDNFYDKIRAEIIIPLENGNEAIDISFERIFLKQNRIFNKTLKLLKENILFSVKREDLNDNEKLDKYFLWYNVKLVNSYNSIPCANEFILILSGLIGINEELIEIIRFIHPGNNYSYAILVEGPIKRFLHNYSIWYVYLDFATDHSGTGRLAKESVDQILHLLESEIHFSEHKIDSNALKEYIKDKEIKELSKQIIGLEKYKADAKGMILELVNAYYFSRLGYQVHWSLKEKFTNYTEIDLLAFRKFRKMITIYVVETTTTEKNLLDEVKKKIEILKNHLSQLLQFFKLEENFNIKFRGMVISDIETNLQVDEIVKIINPKDIINNVKIIKIDKKRLFKILEI